jgi:hypothetical protein
MRSQPWRLHLGAALPGPAAYVTAPWLFCAGEEFVALLPGAGDVAVDVPA